MGTRSDTTTAVGLSYRKLIWEKPACSGPVDCNFRISTDRQGRSGLGLDAQDADVLRHVGSNRDELSGKFIEIESGKRNDRPQLAAAIAVAKKAKAS
jgi:hypothetical protein